jgi:hypothetical protein
MEKLTGQGMSIPMAAKKMYGPTQYQVAKIHNNVPPTSQCKLKTNGQAQGTCWVVEQSWTPPPTP